MLHLQVLVPRLLVLMVGAATVFVGPLAGTIALFAGVICRFVIRGAGTESGIAGLFLAFGLAWIWASRLRHHI